DLLRELSLPTLIVTHDFEDAAALADRVGVIADGRLRQIGSPAELLGAPTDAVVACFAGANGLPGRAFAAPDALTAVWRDDGDTTVLSADTMSGRVNVVVYPWDVSLAHDVPQDSALNHLFEEIVSVVRVGNRARVRLQTLTAEITASSADRLQL